MRPKIVMFIVGIGVVALIGLSVLRSNRHEGTILPADAPTDRSATAGPASAEATNALTAPSVGAVASNFNSSATAATETATSASAVSAAKTTSGEPALTHEEYVEKRVGELMDLGMTDDPGALKTILSEVGNADGDIRKAAIEAVKQFGSTNAIPSLEEAISKTDSAEDKQDLKEAIEFLKLPSFLAKRN